MGFFKKIDKTDPNWRRHRSKWFNNVAKYGRKHGRRIGKTIGSIVKAIWPSLKQMFTKIVREFGPEFIAFAWGRVKQLAKAKGIPGPQKMNILIDDSIDWFVDKGKGIPEKLRLGLQYLYDDMKDRGKL